MLAHTVYSNPQSNVFLPSPRPPDVPKPYPDMPDTQRCTSLLAGLKSNRN
jgi:hypothetical protein